MDNVCLFGASTLGKIAYKSLKDSYDIIGFIDNDSKKHGELFCNLNVYNTDSFKSEDSCYIIICSMYDIEIVRQLIGLGIKKFGVFEVKENSYKVTHYDYSTIYDFSIIDNKVGLIVENNSGSSTYALWKNASKDTLEKYNVVKIDKKLKTNEYYFNILTSKILLFTHDTRCNNSQINIQLWHGVPLKGLSYMSNYDNQNKEANHVAWSKLDYVISCSQTYNTLMNACYGIDGKKYQVLGMPRNDLLFDNKDKSKLEIALGTSIRNKKIVFYMPTFRKTIFGEVNGGTNDYIIGFSVKKLKSFDSFLEQNDILMVLKMHPEEERELTSFRNITMLTEEKLKSSEFDLYEVLGCADVLITDYSSVYFDFLLLDKPIIFYIPDYDIYKENRGFLLEPYEFWTPGARCYEIDSLIREIIGVLKGKDDYKYHRDTICSIIHRYQDNKACSRMWDLIDNILSNNSNKG